MRALVSVLVLVTGCAGAPRDGADITQEMLESLRVSVPLLVLDSVTLTGGDYVRDVAGVELGLVAGVLPSDSAPLLADLDGDGAKEAVAVLRTHRGGTGQFFDLVVAGRAPAPAPGAVELARASLGDRVRVDSVRVIRYAAAPAVRVVLLGHGETDGLCCPTQRRALTFRFERVPARPPRLALLADSLMDADTLRALSAARRAEQAVRELQQLMPRSERAWPGFDLRQLVLFAALEPRGPVYLLGDPAPPPEYRRIRPDLFLRAGAPPDSLSGLRLAMDWNGRAGIATAVSFRDSLVQYIPDFMVHEAFHTHQARRNALDERRFRQRNVPHFPDTSATALALLNLEGTWLARAITSDDAESARGHARLALAVRAHRCAEPQQHEECEAERGVEQNEGSAVYVASLINGRVPGYGPEGAWQDSLAMALSPVRDTRRLERWHFYDTGLAWIHLLRRFAPKPGFERLLELMPPDHVLADVLGVSDENRAGLLARALAGPEWTAARQSAQALVARTLAQRDSAARAFADRPGVPVRVVFGRVASLSTTSRQLGDGRVERTLRFGGNRVVFRGPSKSFCCPPGEVTIAVVTGRTARVDGAAVPLDRTGSARGAVTLELDGVEAVLPNAVLTVFPDSVVLRAIDD